MFANKAQSVRDCSAFGKKGKKKREEEFDVSWFGQNGFWSIWN
jgi:hypothetical protein